MGGYYYSPYQEKLQEEVKRVALTPRRQGLRQGFLIYGNPITLGLLATGTFLAYTPFAQPGPPARSPDPGVLPIYSMGGGMLV